MNDEKDKPTDGPTDADPAQIDSEDVGKDAGANDGASTTSVDNQSVGVDLDQPEHIDARDAEQLVPEDCRGLLKDATDVEVRASDSLNVEHAVRYGAEHQRPWMPDRLVVDATLGRQVELWRVHSMPEGDDSQPWVRKDDNQARSWVVNFDPSGHSQLEIQHQLALPYMPTHFSRVEADPGVRVRIGEVNPYELRHPEDHNRGDRDAFMGLNDEGRSPAWQIEVLDSRREYNAGRVRYFDHHPLRRDPVS